MQSRLPWRLAAEHVVTAQTQAVSRQAQSPSLPPSPTHSHVAVGKLATHGSRCVGTAPALDDVADQGRVHAGDLRLHQTRQGSAGERPSHVLPLLQCWGQTRWEWAAT